MGGGNCAKEAEGATTASKRMRRDGAPDSVAESCEGAGGGDCAKEVKGALDNDLLHVAMGVGDRYRKADPITQTMMRRAFIYSTGRK